MNKKIAAVLLLATIASPLYAAEKLTVVSFGGNNRQAQEKAFYKPFTAQTGVAITADDYNGEMAKIKVMADTGKTSWDVVEVESPELIRGCSEGVFEPLDWSRIGNKEDFIPAAVSDCGVGIFIWSTVLTYDPKKLASSPQGWADFWDLKKYPGKRGLRRGAKFTLEFALLADGVDNKDLYTLLGTEEGVKRAFKKLDEIKSSIQWWDSGAQPLQWLIAGDVVMTSAYNGRVTSAQEEGQSFAMQWNGSLYDLDHWAIVKGAPKKELAERFIAFASEPMQQKNFVEAIPYGPSNTGAMDLLDKRVGEKLPTAPQNLKNARATDAEFWIDHGEDLEERFNAWVNK
ncbi:ABC transporter substrate-binding protein [Pseudomonas sp. FBF18]|jgi:putative spermidine/putrescine transport system substrate-binding protein|uniref:ABC transporter substrate-binding protein n=1 Tax=Pseudomonas TaxID=286 RepID=UPI0006D3E7E1|nr:MULTISPECIES: ABC transporter substrate-binding protein [Pseudomonas]MCP8350409.1 ABC transporter substrate-binding protein [Pseudomonas sp. FBF18]MDD1958342.1 ABC transporter substrate-binding protein [Pseudomonas sp. 8209]PPS63704.1 spermidine/putrescine ABC transporter substrate-binding protein [Pseudomonas sp. BRM28]PPS64270.1 spermidine/putrescine ABC transporter substrate-binding protein [Pseudomonas sp. BRM28]PPS64382.1 spermidine/putrescine ABC transporter substrate-binding protein 